MEGKNLRTSLDAFEALSDMFLANLILYIHQIYSNFLSKLTGFPYAPKEENAALAT